MKNFLAPGVGLVFFSLLANSGLGQESQPKPEAQAQPKEQPKEESKEQSQPSPPPSTPPQLPASPSVSSRGLSIKSGDFTWKAGGYIKIDAIHDFDAIGSTDSFDPRTIPTAGGATPDSNTRLHARQTRLNFDVSGPTSEGNFRAFFEGDFFGTNSAFRIRHAFGVFDEVLGGQTWTTFMDEDAMPETLDFESPIAFPMVRQGQIRWTKPLGGGDYFAIAIEDPDSDVIGPTGVTGVSEEPIPDLTGRIRWMNSRGHVQLGLFSGMAQFDPTVGSTDSVWLWGLNLSTYLTTVGKDNAIAQVTYGDGVGRYRGGVTAAPDSSGNLESIPVFGALLSYQHYWSEKYRSTLCYAWANGDIPSGAPTTVSQTLTYLAVNCIYQYCDRGWAGIEYLHGYNETFDDASGDANRIQLSMRFDF